MEGQRKEGLESEKATRLRVLKQQQGRQEERETDMERRQSCRGSARRGRRAVVFSACAVCFVSFKSIWRKSGSFAHKKTQLRTQNLHLKNRYKIQTRGSNSEVDQETSGDCHGRGSSEPDWMEKGGAEVEGKGQRGWEPSVASGFSAGLTLEGTQFPSNS